jgi:hypothetical protein
MQNQVTKTNSNSRPDGWPRWVWLIVRLCVNAEHRTELMQPDQRALTARALAEKLTDSRKDAEGWRQRALGVEQIYRAQYAAMREAARDHEGLSWRL